MTSIARSCEEDFSCRTASPPWESPEVHDWHIEAAASAPEAEDLIQETYFRAMRAMERLRMDSNIKGWLLTILRNVRLNQLRGRRNSPEMVQMELGDGVVSDVVQAPKGPHNLYVEKVEAEQVRAAIEEVPILFRGVILLREYQDLSYQEMASVPDCPIDSVQLCHV